jgi:hypothetical protein
VVATPVGQTHEIGALLMAAAGATGGWRVVYVGSGLTAEDIAESAEATRAAAVALSLGAASGDRVVGGELRRLRTLLPADVALLVEGPGVEAYATVLRAIGATVVRDVPGLLACLRSLRAERTARAERTPAAEEEPRSAARGRRRAAVAAGP